MKFIVQLQKIAFLLLFFALGAHQVHSQNSSYWVKTVSPYVQKQGNQTGLKNYRTYQLDFRALKDELKTAPFRFSNQKSETSILIPSFNGELEYFNIYETQVLSPALAIKFPNIKTYVGVSKTNPQTKLNISLSPNGIYAMLIKGEQTLFVNPFTDNELYVAFNKSQAEQDLTNAMVCEVEEMQNQLSSYSLPSLETEFVDNASLKRYRLALACSSSYSNFHIDEANLPETASDEEKLEVVLAAMVVTINRVNFIYERDVAVTLQLVANNDQLIQLDPLNDPYDDTGNDINVNQGQIDSTIGNSSYDLGHVFNTGGGGAAAFQSVCENQFKAAAYTGLPNPVGDPFDVDYVAHEIGHQFGGSHTFNNECGGARSESTAVEPGSGSTIMAYAGICPQNVQNNSDAYFHVVSVFEMYNYITQSSGFTCAENIAITNTAPTIDETLQTYSIPVNTPFYLDVEASDADNDELTYAWEQLNNETDSPQPPLAFNFGGPNFRSVSPSTNSTRYFPNLNSVVNDINETWEVLPGVPRDMEFSVLVRDNNVEAGQSAFDQTTISFVFGSPFEVTSQSETNVVWEAGETETITWDVANTNQAPVNSTEVDILLSTNAGQDFDIVLASNVPNSGSAEIVVPDVFGPSCRIMVRSSDNIFFNVNSANFSIDSTAQLECEEVANTSVESIPDGEAPNTAGPALNSSISFNESLFIEAISVSLDITHSYIQDLDITLIGPDNQTVTLFNRDCSNQNDIAVEFNDSASPIPDECSNPFTGVFQPSIGELNQWLGTNAQGEWTLQIQDFWNQDSGQLNSWSLQVCASSLSINNIDANRFSIVPNPNQGQFQINLNRLNSSNPMGELYNLQGKLVQKIQLKPGMLRQTVFLGSLQNGMYLFKINDGKNSYVEKLLIR